MAGMMLGMGAPAILANIAETKAVEKFLEMKDAVQFVAKINKDHRSELKQLV